MTLAECYKALGGDYDEVISRLRSERLVQKFVLKFTDDQSYNTLVKAVAEKDRETAFRAAHTIKGMCQNLSFTGLGESADKLTEALRNEWSDEAPELLEKVTEDYKRAVEAIETLRAGA